MALFFWKEGWFNFSLVLIKSITVFLPFHSVLWAAGNKNHNLNWLQQWGVIWFHIWGSSEVGGLQGWLVQELHWWYQGPSSPLSLSLLASSLGWWQKSYCVARKTHHTKISRERKHLFLVALFQEWGTLSSEASQQTAPHILVIG